MSHFIEVARLVDGASAASRGVLVADGASAADGGVRVVEVARG